MKRPKLITLSILLIFLSLIAFKQMHPLVKLDGFSGNFKRILFNTDDSKYSEGYSNSKFLKIENGMSMKQVLNIIGEPIRADKSDSEYICFWYSMSLNSTHYRRRNIIFDKDIVIKVDSEYYVD